MDPWPPHTAQHERHPSQLRDTEDHRFTRQSTDNQDAVAYAAVLPTLN